VLVRCHYEHLSHRYGGTVQWQLDLLKGHFFNIEEKRDAKISPFFFEFALNGATGVRRGEIGFVVRVMKETAMLWQGRRNRRAFDKDKLAVYADYEMRRPDENSTTSDSFIHSLTAITSIQVDVCRDTRNTSVHSQKSSLLVQISC
jgi:hypothetical protein